MSEDLPDERLVAHLRAALPVDAPAPADERVAELRQQVVRAAESPVARRRPAAPSWRTRALAAAAAAAVALLAVGVVTGVLIDRAGADGDLLARGSDEFVATLVGDDGVEVEVTGDVAPEGRIVVLRSTTLPVLPTGEYYELWFVGDDGERISAGTFHPDTEGDSLVVLHVAADPRLTGTLEITAEPGDGDPAPSGVVVASGEAEVD